MEAKIFELQEAMAERGYTDAEIEEKVRCIFFYTILFQSCVVVCMCVSYFTIADVYKVPQKHRKRGTL